MGLVWWHHLDTTSRAWPIKEWNDNLDFIKIKNYYSVKDTVKRMKRQAKYGEKISAKDKSNKRLLAKITKELSGKKTNNLI